MSSDLDSILTLQVVDTGIGISEEDKQRLFGIFQMGDSSITRPYGGIGVGLALCTKMLHLLGGKLELESNVGKGSTFTAIFQFQCAYIPFVPKTLKDKHFQVLEISGNPSISYVMRPHCDFYNIEIINDPSLANERLSNIFIYPQPEQLKIARELVKKYSSARIVAFCPSNNVIEAPDVKVMINPVPLPSILSLFNEIVWRKEKVKEVKTLSPPHVLLAEDNPTNQLVMRKMFQKLNIDAKIVENGREAIEALEKEKFDVLFLDEYMPVLNGPSAAREIRGCGDKYKDLTIIALTASHGKDDETECINAGMNAFLTKPVTLQMMKDILSKCASGQITASTKTLL